MIQYRKMQLDDLDFIYKDPELRPLVTSYAKTARFAVLVECDNSIFGGVTGFTVKNAAFIQVLIIKEKEKKQQKIYKDGLIRSLIHILERDGIEIIFVDLDKEDNAYYKIGFKKLEGKEYFIKDLEKPIKENFNINSIYWISTKDYFSTINC
jgi:hypothetical protein